MSFHPAMASMSNIDAFKALTKYIQGAAALSKTLSERWNIDIGDGGRWDDIRRESTVVRRDQSPPFSPLERVDRREHEFRGRGPQIHLPASRNPSPRWTRTEAEKYAARAPEHNGRSRGSMEIHPPTHHTAGRSPPEAISPVRDSQPMYSIDRERDPRWHGLVADEHLLDHRDARYARAARPSPNVRTTSAHPPLAQDDEYERFAYRRSDLGREADDMSLDDMILTVAHGEEPLIDRRREADSRHFRQPPRGSSQERQLMERSLRIREAGYSGELYAQPGGHRQDFEPQQERRDIERSHDVQGPSSDYPKPRNSSNQHGQQRDMSQRRPQPLAETVDHSTFEVPRPREREMIPHAPLQGYPTQGRPHSPPPFPQHERLQEDPRSSAPHQTHLNAEPQKPVSSGALRDAEAGKKGTMTQSSTMAGRKPGPTISVNAAGQRTCRQCGQPGRYKDGRCIEKWGPGPAGPGTVCDRCRKRMKRVERRNAIEAALVRQNAQGQLTKPIVGPPPKLTPLSVANPLKDAEEVENVPKDPPKSRTDELDSSTSRTMSGQLDDDEELLLTRGRDMRRRAPTPTYSPSPPREPSKEKHSRSPPITSISSRRYHSPSTSSSRDAVGSESEQLELAEDKSRLKIITMESESRSEDHHSSDGHSTLVSPSVTSPISGSAPSTYLSSILGKRRSPPDGAGEHEEVERFRPRNSKAAAIALDVEMDVDADAETDIGAHEHLEASLSPTTAVATDNTLPEVVA